MEYSIVSEDEFYYRLKDFDGDDIPFLLEHKYIMISPGSDTVNKTLRLYAVLKDFRFNCGQLHKGDIFIGNVI